MIKQVMRQSYTKLKVILFESSTYLFAINLQLAVFIRFCDELYDRRKNIKHLLSILDLRKHYMVTLKLVRPDHKLVNAIKKLLL